ncbi:hypothetical protein ACJ72_05633 [Emergomyces africanus]|uniref:Uncharacterized protein n=1 Tax=Emergomyces africanus TaxID=1955775 RepID=A0A1B7NTD5_9EURO|nr:hypothetical protein ACJ72_05633 [Emergomyces africanus]
MSRRKMSRIDDGRAWTRRRKDGVAKFALLMDEGQKSSTELCDRLRKGRNSVWREALVLIRTSASTAPKQQHRRKLVRQIYSLWKMAARWQK